MRTIICSVAVVAGVAVASMLAAQKKEVASASTTTAEHKVMDPASLQWGDPPAGLPAGAQAALMAGDPGKSGLFTVRLRVPAGYKIAPHTHPTAEQITVISGSFHLGHGDKFDESAGETMGPGMFASMPAGMKHFAWASEETVIQISSEGPFKIVYVNPADDPRTAKK